MTADLHLAQLNIGRLLAPVDDPLVAEFIDNLDQVNGLAEEAPGFVWRLQTDDGNATGIEVVEDDDQIIVNMSVWTDPDATVAATARVRTSVLEADAVVEWGARVEGSLLLAGARVGAGAEVGRSILGPGVVIPDGRHIERRLVTRFEPGTPLRDIDMADGGLVYTPMDGGSE